jgi:hypothetical protein
MDEYVSQAPLPFSEQRQDIKMEKYSNAKSVVAGGLMVDWEKRGRFRDPRFRPAARTCSNARFGSKMHAIALQLLYILFTVSRILKEEITKEHICMLYNYCILFTISRILKEEITKRTHMLPWLSKIIQLILLLAVPLG